VSGLEPNIQLHLSCFSLQVVAEAYTSHKHRGIKEVKEVGGGKETEHTAVSNGTLILSEGELFC
jgi:hypothetical protein